jgi:pyruvate-formate lyase-activating enzyme
MDLRDLPLRCPFCHNVDVTDYIHNDYMDAECKTCGKYFTRRDESRDLFHRLWGESKESDHYYKQIWTRLAFLLRF